MASRPSTFARIFDFSFSHFVAIRLVRMLYILAFVVLIFAWGFKIIPFLTSGNLTDADVFAYSGSAVVLSMFFLFGVRVCLELVVIIFQIAISASDILDELTPGKKP